MKSKKIKKSKGNKIALKRQKKRKLNIKSSLFPITLIIGLLLFLLVLVDNNQLNMYKLLKFETNNSQVIDLPTVIPSPTQSIIEEKKQEATKTFEITPVPNSYCVDVPVLMYHHIEPIEQAEKEKHAQLTVDANIFDQQMKYLIDNGYRFISAEELVEAIKTNSNLEGKPIVVTADDGYSDIYIYAYPIIQKYNIKFNLMITTGLLENNGYLTWDNLKEMVNSGKVFAYNHTFSHAVLTINDDNKIDSEIMIAKRQLDERLGKDLKIFAYPYGSFDQRVVDILTKNGFTAAFSTMPGSYQCDSTLMDLHRTRVGNSPLSSYGL